MDEDSRTDKRPPAVRPIPLGKWHIKTLILTVTLVLVTLAVYYHQNRSTLRSTRKKFLAVRPIKPYKSVPRNWRKHAHVLKYGGSSPSAPSGTPKPIHRKTWDKGQQKDDRSPLRAGQNTEQLGSPATSAPKRWGHRKGQEKDQDKLPISLVTERPPVKNKEGGGARLSKPKLVTQFPGKDNTKNSDWTDDAKMKYRHEPEYSGTFSSNRTSKSGKTKSRFNSVSDPQFKNSINQVKETSRVDDLNNKKVKNITRARGKYISQGLLNSRRQDATGVLRKSQDRQTKLGSLSDSNFEGESGLLGKWKNRQTKLGSLSDSNSEGWTGVQKKSKNRQTKFGSDSNFEGETGLLRKSKNRQIKLGPPSDSNFEDETGVRRKSKNRQTKVGSLSVLDFESKTGVHRKSKNRQGKLGSLSGPDFEGETGVRKKLKNGQTNLGSLSGPDFEGEAGVQRKSKIRQSKLGSLSGSDFEGGAGFQRKSKNRPTKENTGLGLDFEGETEIQRKMGNRPRKENTRSGLNFEGETEIQRKMGNRQAKGNIRSGIDFEGDTGIHGKLRNRLTIENTRSK